MISSLLAPQLWRPEPEFIPMSAGSIHTLAGRRLSLILDMCWLPGLAEGLGFVGSWPVDIPWSADGGRSDGHGRVGKRRIGGDPLSGPTSP